MNKNKRKGFTIVELVIVIAIIAVLAAVLIPTFASLIAKANQAADIQAANQMNVALAAESVIEVPSSFPTVIQILADCGYNAEDKLQPISTGHSFYWYKPYNHIVLAKDESAVGANDAEVIFPSNNEELANSFNDALNETDLVFNLKDGAKFASYSDVEIALSMGNSVTLTEDLSLTNTIDFPAESNATLDLGGHTLIINDGSDLNVYGNLTIQNGNVSALSAMGGDGADERGLGVKSGGTLILDNVVFTAENTNTYNPSLSCFEGGTATLTDCTFNMANGVTSALSIYNGGTMVITDSEFNCQNYNESNNGVILHLGPSLTLNNVTITSGSYCLGVQNASSPVTITGGTYTCEKELYYQRGFSRPTITLNNVIINDETVTCVDNDGTYGDG